MNPRLRAILRAAVLIAVCVGLFLIFPGVLAFTEMAARQVRYFWWMILLLALAVWLIWGVRKRP